MAKILSKAPSPCGRNTGISLEFYKVCRDLSAVPPGGAIEMASIGTIGNDVSRLSFMCKCLSAYSGRTFSYYTASDGKRYIRCD